MEVSPEHFHKTQDNPNIWTCHQQVGLRCTVTSCICLNKVSSNDYGSYEDKLSNMTFSRLSLYAVIQSFWILTTDASSGFGHVFNDGSLFTSSIIWDFFFSEGTTFGYLSIHLWLITTLDKEVGHIPSHYFFLVFPANYSLPVHLVIIWIHFELDSRALAVSFSICPHISYWPRRLLKSFNGLPSVRHLFWCGSSWSHGQMIPRYLQTIHDECFTGHHLHNSARA